MIRYSGEDIQPHLFIFRCNRLLIGLIVVLCAPFLTFIYAPGITPYIFAIIGFTVLLLCSPTAKAPIRALYTIGALIIPLQFLVLTAFFYEFLTGDANAQSIPSALRPTLLGFYFFALIYFITPQLRKNPSTIYKSLGAICLLIYSFVLLYDILSIEAARSILQYLYISPHRVERVEGRFVSFFGTTYWAGFVYFVLFCFFAALVLTRARKRAVAFVHGIILLSLLVSTGSRVFLLLPIFVLPILIILNFSGFKAAAIFIVLCCGAPFALFFSHLGPPIIDWLLQSGTYAARQTGRMLLDPGQAGSLQIRLEQVLYAATHESSIFLPAGLGSNLLLESGYAELLYRTGLFGFLLFFTFCFWLSYKMSCNAKNENDHYRKGLSLGVSAFLLTSPFWMLPNSMIDYPKTAFAFALAVAIGISLLGTSKKPGPPGEGLQVAGG